LQSDGLIAIALKDRSISIRDRRGGELIRLTAVVENGFDGNLSLEAHDGLVRLIARGAWATWDISPDTLAARGRARLAGYAGEKRLTELEARLNRAPADGNYGEAIIDLRSALELDPATPDII
jgi:hypothetical protein